MADMPVDDKPNMGRSQAFVNAFVEVVKSAPSDAQGRLAEAIEDLAPTRKRYDQLMRALPPMWRTLFEDVIETVDARPGARDEMG